MEIRNILILLPVLALVVVVASDHAPRLPMSPSVQAVQTRSDLEDPQELAYAQSSTLWNCSGSLTDDPSSGAVCIQVANPVRTDSRGQRYLTPNW